MITDNNTGEVNRNISLEGHMWGTHFSDKIGTGARPNVKNGWESDRAALADSEELIKQTGLIRQPAGMTQKDF